jgi:hypothetical protein
VTSAAGGALSRGAAWLREHPREAVGAALLLVPAILLRDAILGQGALYQRDIHLYWHAEAEAFVRAVAAGSWPVWDPTLGFGQPLLANSSAQVLYPLTWLNLVIRPWWYYTLFVVTHLVLSAAGAYAAARGLGCSRFASAAGAMLWTASGPFLSLTILWHHFAGAAWLPWTIVGAHALAVGRTTRAALGLAVVLAAQQLAGSFEMSAMGLVVASAVIVRALGWPRPWASATDRRLLLQAAGAVVLALGLSAGQWMATLEAAAHSGRRSLPREVRTYWSVHPLTIGDLFLPGFSANAPVSAEVRNQLFEGREPFLASLYLGLASVGLVLAAFLDRERRPTACILAAGAALALLVSLGRHTPFYDLLVTAAPPLKAFRYPVKAMVLVALPWCLLAAIGIDAWRRNPGADAAQARRLRTLAASVLLIAMITAIGLLLLGSAPAARNAALAAGLAAGTAAAAAWRARGGGRHGAAVAVAVAVSIAIADLVLYHRSLNAVAPTELYTHRPEVLRHVDPGSGPRLYAYDYSVAKDANAPLAPPERRLARVPAGWPVGPAKALADQMALTPVTASRWGLRGSYEVDYTGLFPVHVNQAAYILRGMEGTPAHLRLLQLAGVQYVVALHDGPFTDLQPVAVIPGLFVAPIRLYAVPAPMPHSFVATRTRTGEGLAGVSTLVDGGFDFRSEVLIPAGAPAGPAVARGTSRIVSATPDRMRLAVDAPEGGYLVILESYDPGWRATVDERPAAVVPADVLFRGIALEPGARMVELVYRPPGLVAGLVLSALSLVAAAVLAWRTSRAAVPRAVLP